MSEITIRSFEQANRMKLPDTDRHVLLQFGPREWTVVVGKYVRHKQIEASVHDEFDLNAKDYDEETDTYYWPEGWYQYAPECGDMDVTYWRLNSKVVAWSEIKPQWKRISQDQAGQ